MSAFPPGLLQAAPLPEPVAAALWRGTELGRAGGRTVPSQHPALDRHLPGGGWPCGAITELLQTQPAQFEWRLLGPALAGALAPGGTLLLIGPPLHPHLPGLRKHGIHEKQLVWVDVSLMAERLWAIEQALKANPAGGVVAWLPQARPEHLRRLQVCAQRCDAPVFLFRPATAQQEPSAAPLRLLMRPEASSGTMAIEILKRRGLPHEGVITLSALPTTLNRVLVHRLGRPQSEPVQEESAHALLVGPVPAALPGHAH